MEIFEIHATMEFPERFHFSFIAFRDEEELIFIFIVYVQWNYYNPLEYI